MKTLTVKTPAKINLTLEVLNKRKDGFHNIQSIMQTINLYDFLTFEVEFFKGEQLYGCNTRLNNISIELNGNNKDIPYNESNLVYKAASLFFQKSKISSAKLKIYIEKNIPVSAGLAGGSSNAAGTFFALNKLYNNILTSSEIEELCASLGSDLNFCLYGGCQLCTSRGEILEKLPYFKQNVSLIKPKNIGISAKDAYSKFSLLKDKSIPNNTQKLKNLLLNGKFDKTLIYNSLENALFPYYESLREIKENVKNSLMSGSGSAFFVLESDVNTTLDRSNFEIIENLETIQNGIVEV